MIKSKRKELDVAMPLRICNGMSPAPNLSTDIKIKSWVSSFIKTQNTPNHNAFREFGAG